MSKNLLNWLNKFCGNIRNKEKDIILFLYKDPISGYCYSPSISNEKQRFENYNTGFNIFEWCSCCNNAVHDAVRDLRVETKICRSCGSLLKMVIGQWVDGIFHKKEEYLGSIKS